MEGVVLWGPQAAQIASSSGRLGIRGLALDPSAGMRHQLELARPVARPPRWRRCGPATRSRAGDLESGQGRLASSCRLAGGRSRDVGNAPPVGQASRSTETATSRHWLDPNEAV